jgi:hypothetical protein
VAYRTFAISALSGNALWLNGAQLDAYFLSRRWVRLGFELEGGAGATSFTSVPVSLAYGLAGITGGIQYPARVTPFLDGRAIGGVLHASADGNLTVGNVVLEGASATTYVYGGGVETGVEIYTIRRLYLSAALGWVRTTWRGPDQAAMEMQPTAGLQTKDLVSDSFTLKVGFGI